MSTLNFTPLNPNTTTREVYTNSLTSPTIPANASSLWKQYAEVHQSLLDKLAKHDAMAANLQQTYMTPAANKNKVYFMWDFVGRTLHFLYLIPHTASAFKDFEDIVSRSAMTAMLILDEPAGRLDMMVGPSTNGQTYSFGEDILADARRLKTIN